MEDYLQKLRTIGFPDIAEDVNKTNCSVEKVCNNFTAMLENASSSTIHEALTDALIDIKTEQKKYIKEIENFSSRENFYIVFNHFTEIYLKHIKNIAKLKQ